jgi:hypothetical protein
MKLQLRRRLTFAAASWVLVAVVGAPSASAQTGMPDSQARYNSEIARCNRSGLPAPAREACIRQAGVAFDQATGGITGSRETISPDGRATVIEPMTATPDQARSRPRAENPPPPLLTTPDGRARVVNPAAQ